MGGRGSTSGVRASGAYTRDKTIKLNGEKKYVERLTGMRSYGGDDAVVLEAKTDGNGNLTLSYAQAIGYRQQNKKTSYAQYEISAGLTNRTGSGKSTEITSNNINWDNVKTVSGKTYGTQSFMREHGFTWDSAKKIWVKNKR